jgi:hypothetical protein
MSCSNNSIFDSPNTYIKFQGSDLVSVEGANLLDRLLLNNVIIPFKQILKGRIILKPGQSNYLFNFLGLGDNATFLALVPKFDIKSVMEEDNYVNFVYSTDLIHPYSFKEIMILTGNSTNRIPQLYLSNLNPLYPVVIETIVAVIDDTQTFFVDTTNQLGLTYTNLSVNNIQTWIVNESIVVYDNNIPPNALVYLTLSTITSIQQQGTILIINDLSIGNIFLQFKTVYDATQADSAINYVLNTPNVVIGGNYPDLNPPTIYFNNTFGASGSSINLLGSTTPGPYTSNQGLTFSASTNLSYYGGTILATDIISGAISIIVDNKDGVIIPLPNQIFINGSNIPLGITSSGIYPIKFNISDLAGLEVNPNLVLNLTIN